MRLSDGDEVPDDRCCDLWDEARQPGTDNEGYGHLIHYPASTFVGGRHICTGSPLTGTRTTNKPGFHAFPVSFCPFCGAKKD